VTRVLGVDGCRTGWVAVALVGGGFADARLVESFGELVEDPAAVIGVDIPLGSVGASRAADREARRLLGPRGASVFAALPREGLDCPDHASANRAVRARYGVGVSAQAWNLAPKMRDVEPHWRAAPHRIVEVHPELSFRAMAGAALAQSKHTWAGLRARLALLARVGIVVPDDPGPAGTAGADDVVDAAAVAWSAARYAAGAAQRVPVDDERDAAGRLVTISW
jgi:predicted RNase H-like nuclease